MQVCRLPFDIVNYWTRQRFTMRVSFIWRSLAAPGHNLPHTKRRFITSKRAHPPTPDNAQSSLPNGTALFHGGATVPPTPTTSAAKPLRRAALRIVRPTAVRNAGETVGANGRAHLTSTDQCPQSDGKVCPVRWRRSMRPECLRADKRVLVLNRPAVRWVLFCNYMHTQRAARCAQIHTHAYIPQRK